MSGMDRDTAEYETSLAARALVARSIAGQSLPAVVSETSALSRVATIMRAASAATPGTVAPSDRSGG